MTLAISCSYLGKPCRKNQLRCIDMCCTKEIGYASSSTVEISTVSLAAILLALKREAWHINKTSKSRATGNKLPAIKKLFAGKKASPEHSAIDTINTAKVNFTELGFAFIFRSHHKRHQ